MKHALLLSLVASTLQASFASPVADLLADRSELFARQNDAAAGNANLTASSGSSVNASAFAGLPKVVATYDRNSSSTGTYSSLNSSGIPAINAPSQHLAPEHDVKGSHGAVACEVDVCANVGVDTLAKGGSAADAAIATALCVGVTATFHSNIGGGGFALVRGAQEGGSAQYEMIDFRETMPALGNETLYSNNSNPTASTIGGLAVGVPGELRGWEKLHKKHGRLPWADLFAPAIEIANGGFRVGSQLGVVIAQYAAKFTCADPLAAEVYCPNGTAVGEGEIIRKPRYAKTLQTIAHEGPDAFYSGAIATNTISAIRARGGIMTLADLANYTAIVRQPNQIEFTSSSGAKYNVFSTVAPSSGNVVLSTLKVMDEFNTNKPSDDKDLNLHRLIEATKFGYSERASYGDPAFQSNVSSLQQKVISASAAEYKQQAINDTGVLPLTSYNPQRYTILSDNGTSQISVIDSNGSAVTLTTTVNLLWGSQVMTADGILLNNEMDDFSSPGSSNSFGYVPTAANYIEPGKRPLSSISPTIAEDAATGEIFFAIGSAGGSRIITANIINAYNLLHSDGAIDIQTSLAQPRWHDQLQPGTTLLEWAASSPVIPNWQGFNNQTAEYLRSVGHNVTYTGPGSSSANGVQRFKDGTLLAGREIRQLSSGGYAY